MMDSVICDVTDLYFFFENLFTDEDPLLAGLLQSVVVEENAISEGNSRKSVESDEAIQSSDTEVNKPTVKIRRKVTERWFVSSKYKRKKLSEPSVQKTSKSNDAFVSQSYQPAEKPMKNFSKIKNVKVALAECSTLPVICSTCVEHLCTRHISMAQCHLDHTYSKLGVTVSCNLCGKEFLEIIDVQLHLKEKHILKLKEVLRKCQHIIN